MLTRCSDVIDIAGTFGLAHSGILHDVCLAHAASPRRHLHVFSRPCFDCVTRALHAPSTRLAVALGVMICTVCTKAPELQPLNNTDSRNPAETVIEHGLTGRFVWGFLSSVSFSQKVISRASPPHA
jgi:hypothetical protein